MKATLFISAILPAICLANPLIQRQPACVAGPQMINGRSCVVECGADYPGGDYDFAAKATFADCVSACAADQRCSAAQYHTDRGVCYFKNKLGNRNSQTLDNSVICEGTAATTSSSVTTYANGQVCTTYVGMDRPGGNFKSVKTDSLCACNQACSAEPTCVTAQFHRDNGYCYLKDSSNPADPSTSTDTVDCLPSA